MAKRKKRPLIKPEAKETGKDKSSEKSEQTEDNEFDFGGFPKNVSLKRNMGCGG